VPDIPAIAETVPGYESSTFYGMSAPKDTPTDIVDTLNKAVNEALKRPQAGGGVLPRSAASRSR